MVFYFNVSLWQSVGGSVGRLVGGPLVGGPLVGGSVVRWSVVLIKPNVNWVKSLFSRMFCYILWKWSYQIKYLWSDLNQCFQNSYGLPTLTPQTAIFGFWFHKQWLKALKNKFLINHILLIIKLCVYKSSEKKS